MNKNDNFCLQRLEINSQAIYGVSWIYEKHRLGGFPYWYSSIIKSVVEGISTANFKCFSDLSFSLVLYVVVEDKDTNETITYSVGFDECKNGIKHEEIHFIGMKDSSVWSKYELSRGEDLPCVCGTLGENEIPLSEVAGEIDNYFEDYTPFLLSRTTFGAALQNFFRKARIINDPSSLYLGETSLKSLCTKLDTLLDIPDGTALGSMREVAPCCDFGIREITDTGLAIPIASRVGAGNFHFFDLSDMGSGYGQLAVILAIMHCVMSKNELVFVEDMFASIHPTLRKKLIQLYSGEENVLGQIITSPFDKLC